MAITTKIPGAPGVSLRYITIGALIAVPSGLSYVFFGAWALHPVAGYFRMCAFVLGIIFLLIGFGVGRIGQVSGEHDKVTTVDTPVAVVPPAAATSVATTPVYTKTINQEV